MKVIYEFDTDNENDAEDWKIFRQAKEMFLVLNRMDDINTIRKIIDKSAEYEQGFKDAMECFREALNRYKVDLDI